MNPEGRRQVNLVVLGCPDCVSSGRQITVVDMLSGGDEILSGYRCTTWDYGRRTADSLVEECWCTTRQREGGARTWLLLSIIIASHGGRGGGGHTRTGAPHSPFVGSSEVLAVLLGEEFVGTRRATLRSHLRVKADDSTVDGAATASIVPVFWPVFLDSTPRFANVLEICATEVLMLLNVEPEV